MTLTATDIESESADNFTFMVKTPPSGKKSVTWLSAMSCLTLEHSVQKRLISHDSSENESDSFTYVAHDGLDESSVATVSVTITPTNDAPVIADETVTVTMHEDNGAQNPVDPDTGLQEPLPLVFALSLTATDIDSATLTGIVSAPADGEAEVISASGTGDPTDLENGNQAGFTYAPRQIIQNPASATDTFTVQVSDGFELSDTIEVNVVVEQINDAPILVNALSDETIMATEAFHEEILQIPASSSGGYPNFSDAEDGLDLAFSTQLENGNALPSWLTFDPTTRTFNGVATNDDEGSVTIRVVATDSNGLSVQDDFELTVTLSNEPISVVNEISDQTGVQGETFELTVQGLTYRSFSMMRKRTAQKIL